MSQLRSPLALAALISALRSAIKLHPSFAVRNPFSGPVLNCNGVVSLSAERTSDLTDSLLLGRGSGAKPTLALIGAAVGVVANILREGSRRS